MSNSELCNVKIQRTYMVCGVMSVKMTNDIMRASLTRKNLQSLIPNIMHVLITIDSLKVMFSECLVN